jgi:hypothetical protein
MVYIEIKGINSSVVAIRPAQACEILGPESLLGVSNRIRKFLGHSFEQNKFTRFLC